MRESMEQVWCEKIMRSFSIGLITDSEAANAWALKAINLQSIEEGITLFRVLPKEIQLAVCRVFNQIRLNDFKWSPFMISNSGSKEIVLNAKQRSLSEAILGECNTATRNFIRAYK